MSGGHGLCLWCERRFTAHRGGSPRSFCSSSCRTAFHTAARRWSEHAIAAGSLTISDIRNGISNGDGKACTLSPGSISPAPVPEPQSPASAAAEGADEAADLLDDFLIALLEELGEGWPDLVAALPDKIFARIDHWLEVRFGP